MKFKIFLVTFLLTIFGLPLFSEAQSLSFSPSQVPAGQSFTVSWQADYDSTLHSCRLRLYDESSNNYKEEIVRCGTGSVQKSYSLPGTYMFHLRVYKTSGEMIFQKRFDMVVTPTTASPLLLVASSNVVANQEFTVGWKASVSPASHICKIKFYNQTGKSYQEEVVDCGSYKTRQFSYSASGSYNFELNAYDRLGSAHALMYRESRTVTVAGGLKPVPTLSVPAEVPSKQSFSVGWQVANSSANDVCKLYYYKAGTAYVEEMVNCADSRSFSYSSAKDFNFALRVYDKSSGSKIAEATKTVTITAAPVPTISVPETAVSGKPFSVSWSVAGASDIFNICKLYYYKAGINYVLETVNCSDSRSFAYSSIKEFNFVIGVYNRSNNTKLSEAAGSISITATPPTPEPEIIMTVSTTSARVGDLGNISWVLKNIDLNSFDCEKNSVLGVKNWGSGEINGNGSATVLYETPGTKYFRINCSTGFFFGTKVNKTVTVNVLDKDQPESVAPVVYDMSIKTGSLETQNGAPVWLEGSSYKNTISIKFANFGKTGKAANGSNDFVKFASMSLVNPEDETKTCLQTSPLWDQFSPVFARTDMNYITVDSGGAGQTTIAPGTAGSINMGDGLYAAFKDIGTR